MKERRERKEKGEMRERRERKEKGRGRKGGINEKEGEVSPFLYN